MRELTYGQPPNGSSGNHMSQSVHRSMTRTRERELNNDNTYTVSPLV